MARFARTDTAMDRTTLGGGWGRMPDGRAGGGCATRGDEVSRSTLSEPSILSGGPSWRQRASAAQTTRTSNRGALPTRWPIGSLLRSTRGYSTTPKRRSRRWWIV